MAIKKENNNSIKDNNLKDIKKEINNYVNNLKKELTENISEKVNNQIEISVNKRMKEEEKKLIRIKNRKILKRDILILILTIIVLYFGYCLYDINYFNIRKNNYENISSTNNSINTPIYNSEYYIENYRYLIDNMQINDDSIFDLYTGNLNKDNISNDLKLKLAYKNIDHNSLEYNNGILTFKSEYLLTSLKKILGNDITIENKVFNYNNINFIYYNDTYLGLETKLYQNNLVYDIVSCKEEDNLLIFEVIVGKLDNDILLNIDSNIITNKYNNEKLNNYKDKLSTFKYTFEKKDNKYIFNKIELL